MKMFFKVLSRRMVLSIYSYIHDLKLVASVPVQTVIHAETAPRTWKLPVEGSVKINVDGGMMTEEMKGAAT